MRNGHTGFLFDIQRCSIHDGPGIRTTVFLKGCPLQCAWCHNPESQYKGLEIAFYKSRCMGCGNCITACPKHCHAFNGIIHEVHRSKCVACGKCAENCPANALTLIGRPVTVSEMMDEIMADSPFYEVSGGGMTVSGGEPLLQPEFTLELLKAAKEKGFHTCIETCGFCAPEHLLNILPFTDLFLFDIKTTADSHNRWTGVPFEPILRSLRTLDEVGGRIVLRCPLIPCVNLNESHMHHIAQIASSLKNAMAIHLEPYHPVGIAKYEAIGRSPVYAEDNGLGPVETEKWAEYLRNLTGLKVEVF